MKRFLQFAIIAASSVSSATVLCAQESVITTPPAGREVECYADFRSFQNVFDFVWDSHSKSKIVYTEDGKAYIPNVLMRNTMANYVVGTVDEAAKTITVEAGQPVYKFPNIDGTVNLYMLNASGEAGDKTAGTFNTEPLVFDINDDGSIRLRTSDTYPMFGIAATDNTDYSHEVYGLGAGLVFSPVEPTLALTKYFTLSYIDDRDDKEYSATITGYETDSEVWFKGFDPRYPAAWIKAVKVGDELRAPSLQLVNMTSTEIPTVMAASSREFNYDTYEYDYTHAMAFLINFDKATGAYTAFTETNSFLTNLTSYDEESADVYQAYRNIKIEPIEVLPAVPAKPDFYGYDASSLSKEYEFTFLAYPKSVDGTALLKDAMFLRYYINGEVYTFEKSKYTRQETDLTLVPFNYSDNGAFVSGSDGEKHYVYFLAEDMPADLETIGVEVVYTIDGVTNVSERLVYNVKTEQTEYLGIGSVESGLEIVATAYYDLSGRAVASDAKGLLIKVDTLSDGTASVSKILRK